ncbi:ferritin-like domain-containing protein [Flavobacterium sp.]|uniref:ferritin-like domain-containing protein n=1 Tax=Flavobacterium sp. TaxID=239 RepID=UPI0026161547|nr:ferritin-like domain-containing protein [Flavobacterium sp.]
MNIIKFIESFTNDSFLNTKGSRRESFSQFGKIGSNAAKAAVPFGLASMLFTQKANAASSAFLSATADTPTSALQLALILEYLEDEFYATALDTNGLIPSADRAVFEQISQHEAAHVEFLMGALDTDAPAKPTFDFTANGTFDPFNNYDQFLALSQAFEDTGVRAYKGQAGNLITEPALLTAALQIHSVEARHASQVRRLRGLKGWIPGNDEGGHPAAADAVYAGEANTNQLGFNTANVQETNGPAIPAIAGSESYDEPLTGQQATNIANLFIVQ